MRIVSKWLLVICSLCTLAFFCCDLALYPTISNIICTVIAALVTTFYIIMVFKEFDVFND